MAITRLALDGYGARRAGSFAGKSVVVVVTPAVRVLAIAVDTRTLAVDSDDRVLAIANDNRTLPIP